MVIAGMNPLISSCLTVSVFRAGSSDSTCPWSVNVRSSDLVHVETAKATERQNANRARMCIVYSASRVTSP